MASLKEQSSSVDAKLSYYVATGSEGCVLGTPDGESEGTDDGANVGCVLGAPEGMLDGAEEWHKIREKFRNDAVSSGQTSRSH